MHVTETETDGLKRGYAIAIPAAEIAGRRDARLAEIAAGVPIAGFRRGEAPRAVILQRFGASVLGEVLEDVVAEAVRRLIADRRLRPAMPPKVEVGAFAEDTDLVINVGLELLPDVPLPDLSDLHLERLRAQPGQAHLDRALARLAMRHGRFEDLAGEPAARGDILVCDVEGGVLHDLLANGVALGARVGSPGLPPTSWSLDASPGLSCDIVATGSENGLICFDARLRGMTGRDAFLRLFPARPKEQKAAPGQVLTLCMRARVLTGELPTAARVRLGFNERAEDDFLRSVRAPAQLGDAEIRGSFVLTDDERLAYARPLLDIGFPPGIEVDVTFRIGPARIFAGAEEPEALLFAGGSMIAAPIEVGAAGVGFSSQLEGLAPGETRVVEAMLPADHAVSELANRRVRHAVTATGLKRRRPLAHGEELARALKLPDTAAMRVAVMQSLQRECDARSGQRLRIALLDRLAAGASFPVPECLLGAEFDQIWQRVRPGPAEGAGDEALRADYRVVAARRVRLRLLVTRLAEAHEVQVTEAEMARAIRRDAARYPGQERQVLDFYRGNAAALEALRAPLVEAKVIDLLIAGAAVTDRVVTPEELGME
ncbi:hypothetical protein GXW78_19230 [Roseomonas terrae]|uniref:Trigger factor n=1 Tax=Neoroseomonas terrae TaxID=424799 RepID=A0ABS5ELA5_9PROT|nr:trigger factor [Neoroseomonas terrae]MBR0651811.1 hypothetical protein [Neoroseomonas terrae]